MLSRATDAPDELPDTIPDWFIDACERLAEMNKEGKEQKNSSEHKEPGN